MTDSSPLLPRMLNTVPSSSFLWRSGAILVATGMLFGAFGAHGLKSQAGITPDDIQAWRATSNYAIANGLGLLLVSMHPRFSAHRFAGPAILTGGALFSGSIYVRILLKLSGRLLGLVTPLGGMIMVAGYVCLAL